MKTNSNGAKPSMLNHKMTNIRAPKGKLKFTIPIYKSNHNVNLKLRMAALVVMNDKLPVPNHLKPTIPYPKPRCLPSTFIE